MLLNEKLKSLRKNSKLTQEKLAEELNVSRQAITKWESGDGIPDIENLKQISKYFNISLDELLKEDVEIEEKRLDSNIIVKEVAIDHGKNFDFYLKKCNNLEIISIKEEKVKIEVVSNGDESEEEFNNNVEIKIDNTPNLRNGFDLNIINKSKTNKPDIKFYIPQKYLEKIEIKADLKIMNITNLILEDFEFDGYVKYVNITKSKGQIVLNSTRADVEVCYDIFEGRLEINSINSTSYVSVPKDTKYKTENKGRKTKIIDSIETEDSKNIIELNGFASKLVMIHR